MFRPVLPDVADHGHEDRPAHASRKRRRLMLAILIALGGYLAIQIPFRIWRGEVYRQLARSTEVVQTRLGPVEYSSVGQGPPVLYVHSGYGGADRNITIDGYRVITPSRPGYLRTPLSVGTSPAEQAKAFAALLDSLGVDRVAVFATSAGGGPAIAFAAAYPDRVAALVLRSAITSTWVRPVPRPGPYRRITDRVFGRDFADWSMLAAAKLSSPFSGMAKVAAIRENFLSAVESGPWSKRHPGFANDRRQMAQLAEPHLGDTAPPTLIVHGTADRAVELDQAEIAARAIPGAELVLVEGADHAFSPPHAATLDSLTLAFLARHHPASHTTPN